MRFLALQFLALAHVATAFIIVPARSVQRPKQPPSSFDSSGSSPTSATKKTTTSLFIINPIFFGPELIAPAILIIGSAVATILASQDEDVSLAEYISRSKNELEPTAAPVAIEKPPTPEPAPTPPVVATIPAPAPAPAVETPLPTTTPASSDSDDASSVGAGDSIAELRRGVAKTLDTSSSVPNTQLLQRSSPAPAPELLTEQEDDEKKLMQGTKDGNKTVKKRGLFRKIWRVIKKIVAPWRKWENIS